ncbi:hypothetical protein J3A84_04840 [Proteiniclasticum sp. SCR006]|uniref:Uncharacterized protein n=1 Tax=Proteiniclasticum aestuarii TaxID=2817862 RepID=A0A939HAG2_9CLOT|nr:hypothetical protein [Proteiniclasticum aestuarii]MBO1264367.1 hypothetical protein [Proteiniclasticum aestuarii]
MILAVKGNREIKIDVDEKEKYLDNGYSLFEKSEGKLTSLTPPVKKTKEMISLEKENAELKKRLAAFEKDEAPEEEKQTTRGKGK